MWTTNDLKNKDELYQAVGDQTWTKQKIEECVTFVRLELYNRDYALWPESGARKT